MQGYRFGSLPSSQREYGSVSGPACSEPFKQTEDPVRQVCGIVIVPLKRPRMSS